MRTGWVGLMFAVPVLFAGCEWWLARPVNNRRECLFLQALYSPSRAVRRAAGFVGTSSLSRVDNGAGTCELMWVSAFEVE